MRLVIIGGSAHSTPHLFASDALTSCERLHVTLVGRSADRLSGVRRAIEIVAWQGVTVTCNHVDDVALESELREADAILIQVRVGGYEGRRYDETFPLEFGIAGDEGLGPGGLAAAWRTWPTLEHLLERIETSGSVASVLLMTSPIGILTRCAARTFPRLRVVGICELPWATLLDVARCTGATLPMLETRYVGVNHLGWFTSIRDASRDLVGEYARTLGDATFPSRELVERIGAIPLKYLRLHYDREDVVREQQGRASRAEALADLERVARLAYAGDDRAAVAGVLAKRPAPWYEQAVTPYLLAMAGHPRGEMLFLTTRNDGYVPWLAEDDFLEIPYKATREGLARASSGGSVPDLVAPVLERFVAYERLASEAVASRDHGAVRNSLEAHPWLDDLRDSRRLAERIILDYSDVARARM